MEEQRYFMRVRGRVLGPYDQDKLQSLVQRGQLNRMHELSTDGVTWSRASKFAELFAAANPATPPGPTEQPFGVGLMPVAAVAKRGWHYTCMGAERGPVDFVQLQSLASSGQLGGDDLVWVEGMAEWTPARQVPGLIVAAPAAAAAKASAAAAPVSQPAGDALPTALCRAATSPRPWVIFIAVVLYVYAVLSLVGGAMLLIEGANSRTAVAVASGLFSLVHAVLATWGATLLLVYVSRLNNLNYSPDVRVLERVFDALRSCWLFVSIVLIVMLAFAAVLAIWIFSFGVTLRDGGWQ